MSVRYKLITCRLLIRSDERAKPHIRDRVWHDSLINYCHTVKSLTEIDVRTRTFRLTFICGILFYWSAAAFSYQLSLCTSASTWQDSIIKEDIKGPRCYQGWALVEETLQTFTTNSSHFCHSKIYVNLQRYTLLSCGKIIHRIFCRIFYRFSLTDGTQRCELKFLQLKESLGNIMIHACNTHYKSNFFYINGKTAFFKIVPVFLGLFWGFIIYKYSSFVATPGRNKLYEPPVYCPLVL